MGGPLPVGARVLPVCLHALRDHGERVRLHEDRKTPDPTGGLPVDHETSRTIELPGCLGDPSLAELRVG